MIGVVELAPELREALGAHEVFRRLGFTSDEIYLRTHVEGLLLVTVRRDGLEANVLASPCELPPDRVLELWPAAVEWWNHDATDGQRRAIFESCRVRRGAASVVGELIATGFKIGHLSPGLVPQ